MLLPVALLVNQIFEPLETMPLTPPIGKDVADESVGATKARPSANAKATEPLANLCAGMTGYTSEI
jgi:hypothetical protein